MTERPDNPTIYKCTGCPFKSSDWLTAQDHKESHCSSSDSACDDVTSSYKDLVVGEKVNGSFSCPVCEYKSHSRSHVSSHLNTQHIGLKPHKCSFCTFRTAYRQSLETHLKRHTGIRPYKCEFCLWSATESEQLKIHQRKHTGKKPYSCNTCIFRAASKSALSAHQKTHFNDNFHFKCIQCPFKTRTRAKLHNHMKTHELKYCSFCSFSTNSSPLLRTHVKSHKLICKFCLKVCKDSAKLKEHEVTHTGLRKWQCKECPYNSSKKSLLEKHEEGHGNSEIGSSLGYSCTVCSFKTDRPSSLGNHMRTHRKATK